MTYDVLATEDGDLLTTEDGVLFEVERGDPLLIQAVVRPLGDMPDGQLIAIVEPAWRAILDVLRQDPGLRFQIAPRQWEEMIAAAYRSHGFDEVILTPRSGDHGRDIIATMKGRFEVRVIDSVKALGEGRRVGHDDVRALLGVMSGDQKTNKAVLTTTAEFAPGIDTDPFIAPFLPTRLQLVNGRKLLEWLEELRTKT